MAETGTISKKTLRNIIFRALKATAKGVIFYVVYFVLWSFLAPATEIIPGLQGMVETFVAVYIVLMIIGDLTAGTIYQYFFSAAKTLFVIGYLILSLGGGIMGFTFENVNLMIDIRLFLAVAMVLSLLGFAKSVLQAINYQSEKAEQQLI
jgi:hypothetical protein